MKNTFGNSLTMTIFGESHGDEIGVVLDGLAPGIPVSEEQISQMLTRRRPAGAISTKRVEADAFRIVSGVYHGTTTGTPLTILIPNASQHSDDYEKAERIARPGHADYTAFCKYHGYEDYRGGGHFSGRITAAVVAAGAVVMAALREKKILIGTHIAKLGTVSDASFGDWKTDVETLRQMSFPVLSETAGAEMKAQIERAAADGDSVGGILETVIAGLPAGVGEPFFDSVEGVLAHALFAIPGIKGVQFGDGFDGVCSHGSEFNDAFRMENGEVITRTNHNGGINGGITNGMPVLFRCAVKPTPSIYREQDSIDLKRKENAKLIQNGRHDPAIVHRAAVVVDCMTAVTVYDMLSSRFGTDYFAGGTNGCNTD